jgi:hypothetical protein
MHDKSNDHKKRLPYREAFFTIQFFYLVYHQAVIFDICLFFKGIYKCAAHKL